MLLVQPGCPWLIIIHTPCSQVGQSQESVGPEANTILRVHFNKKNTQISYFCKFYKNM